MALPSGDVGDVCKADGKKCAQSGSDVYDPIPREASVERAITRAVFDGQLAAAMLFVSLLLEERF